MTDKFGLGIKSPNFLLLKIPDFNTVTLSFSSRRQEDLNLQLGNKWWYSVKLVEVLVLPKLMSKVHTHPTHCLKPYYNQQRTVPAVVQKQHPLIPPACFTALVATSVHWGSFHQRWHGLKESTVKSFFIANSSEPQVWRPGVVLLSLPFHMAHYYSSVYCTYKAHTSE